MRAGGFTLLPVVLAMSVVAAVAYLLNRDAGVHASMINSQLASDRARYAAEAGLQAANFAVQSAGCGGVYPTASTPVTYANFAGASYSAYSAIATGSPVTLVATGTYQGVAVTLTRPNVIVYQPRQTKVYQPGPNTSQDTYLDSGQERNFGGDTRLRLQSGKYQPLVKIDLSDLPRETLLVPWYDSANARMQPAAVLSLYQYDIAASGTGSLKLNIHPIVRSWIAGTKAGGGSPNGATWLTYDGVNRWSAPGMGYDPTAIASTPYVAALGWIDWTVTDEVGAWVSGLRPNNGIWLVPTGGSIGNTSFISSNDTANPTWRPKLTLSVQEPCGSERRVNVPLGQDAHLTSGTDQTRNFGATSVMDLNQGTPERRIVVFFDVSSIPPGTVVKSANLRL